MCLGQVVVVVLLLLLRLLWISRRTGGEGDMVVYSKRLYNTAAAVRLRVWWSWCSSSPSQSHMTADLSVPGVAGSMDYLLFGSRDSRRQNGGYPF